MDATIYLDTFFNFWTGLAIVLLVLLKTSVRFVPQNRADVVERFGKYNQTMTAGLNFVIPMIDRVAASRSLKEEAFDVPGQTAITKDNISLGVDGVLYIKVVDAARATYGVQDYIFAVTQLAQTTMRAEIGKMDLDKTFEDRDQLNKAIISCLNEASAPWGVQVMRYEIKDILPPQSVLEAMERQMKAEREKRAAILESEGERQSSINRAEGAKQARVLAAEADKAEQILNAEGEAQAIFMVAAAKARSIEVIGKTASTAEGQKAVQMDLATQAIAAKAAIAKQSTVVLMDAEKSSAANIVAEAVAVVAAMNQSDAFRATSSSQPIL